MGQMMTLNDLFLDTLIYTMWYMSTKAKWFRKLETGHDLYMQKSWLEFSNYLFVNIDTRLPLSLKEGPVRERDKKQMLSISRVLTNQVLSCLT